MDESDRGSSCDDGIWKSSNVSVKNGLEGIVMRTPWNEYKSSSKKN